MTIGGLEGSVIKETGSEEDGATGKVRTPLSSPSRATKGEEPGRKWRRVSKPHTASCVLRHFFLLGHLGEGTLKWNLS